MLDTMKSPRFAGPAKSQSAETAVRSPFGPPSEIGTSVIGTDLAILGTGIVIISQNQLQINGDIRGDVAGRQVTIGNDGSVIGTVSAEKVEVLGGVKGSIKAATVTLHASCEVEGDILHEKLVIAEGSRFEGRVRRSKDVGQLIPNLDPNSYAMTKKA